MILIGHKKQIDETADKSQRALLDRPSKYKHISTAVSNYVKAKN